MRLRIKIVRTALVCLVALSMFVCLAATTQASGRGWIIDGHWGTKPDGSDGEEKGPCGQYCEPCINQNPTACAHPTGYCEGTYRDVQRKGEPIRLCYRGFDEFLKLCRELRKDNGECLSELVIVGHGYNGGIGLGSGQESTEAGEMRRINGNEEVWAPIFKRLVEEGILCPDGKLIFAGCFFGAGQDGIDKLWKIVSMTGITSTATWHLIPRGQVDRALGGKNAEEWILINPGDPKPNPHELDKDKEWVR